MVPRSILGCLIACTAESLAVAIAERASDPCAAIASVEFSDPVLALACLRSFPVNETIKENVLAVVGGALDFFTFEAEQLHSPPPFQESSVNLRLQLARIQKTTYATDYDFNRDLFNTINSLNDGHTMWFPSCYWAVFQNILPAPIQSLEINGKQNIYIAPDAVALMRQLGNTFTDYYLSIGFNWEQYAGAKVLKIGGMDAYDYVDHIASTYSGNYLDHGIRVNSVFSSYRISGGIWSQRLGDLAGALFPDLTSLTFELIRANSTKVDTVAFPYRAAYTRDVFIDKASFWEANCAVKNTTNGIDSLAAGKGLEDGGIKRPRAAIVEAKGAKAVALPAHYRPTAPLLVGNDDLRAYILPESNVGVLMVGDFEPVDYVQFQQDVINTIDRFHAKGVTKLIVDVTNNGGGYVCLAVYLHLALVGSSFGYGGFQTSARATPLAVKIVAADIKRGVNSSYSFYAPDTYTFLNGTRVPQNYDYMSPVVPHAANGLNEPTSQRILDICTPFDVPLPSSAPFKPENIVIVGNGQCASSCALFTTAMHERHGIRIAVFGGKPGEPMEYKGMAGAQVLEWSTLDSEIKTASLKSDPLSPPDLLIDGDIRINWRTAYSWYNLKKPIAFESERAQYRFPYTPDTVVSPQNLWAFIAKKLL